MLHEYYSRIIVGGLAGDSGKTIVSCGLLSSFKNRGVNVTGFKKGPDYIDAAWMSLASGKPARNLDSFMMGFPAVKNSFLKKADKNGINIIEGNRGLFDGVNSKGTHSTAELALLLQSPVIIVEDISKVTRTAAVSIIGCIHLNNKLNIAGVILNRAASSRHSKIAKDAIEGETGIPVLGVIPKLSEKFILPERHLGLITPGEFEQKSVFLMNVRNIIEDNVDVTKIMKMAVNAPSIKYDPKNNEENSDQLRLINSEENFTEPERIKIGFFKDKSFSFYYPENLEMLVDAGADLIPISASNYKESNNIDALYIGGGFPEMNLENLASNTDMIFRIKKLADEGLPIYAECGGLMYLAKEIIWKDKKFSLSGVLPIEIQMHDKPQGHGYSEAVVDSENPFYKKGTAIKGHEFHYSKINKYDIDLKTALSLSRGTGCFNHRDGIIYKNVFASYTHVHALATPEWVKGMIKCARDYKKSKQLESVIQE
jgi:cobyrinic acid a,c-diamide synthase